MINMKKWLVSSLIVIIVGVSIYIGFTMFYPKEINISAQGVKYRLGDTHIDKEQSIQVTIKGKVTRDLFGNRTFTGSVDLEGEDIPVPLEERELILPLTKQTNYSTYLTFSSIENGRPFLHNYGNLYIKDDLSQISITVLERDPEDKTKSSWNGESGIMISAPASTREQGLAIANELMQDLLGEFTLK